ncbi:molybdate ABC transporter substrate-binding protein [Nakamurella silvestris]|nr:molybdate ABC transporter substrate-binding protein [Nakamurella silvestris]
MRRAYRATVAAATAVVLFAGVTACGSDDPAPSSPSATASSTGGAATGTDTPAAAGTITVFAAASLKNTFTELGATFEADNPGSKVVFSFAGSSDLVTQITNGAPADVFASADTKNMTKVTDATLTADAPVDFASNTLTIVTPPDNPAGITGFADLAKAGVNLVICNAEVPCGSATQKVATATGVTLKPVSEESSVTDVLNKVTSGEADAGLVYVTDATAAGDKVKAIAFPESSEAVNTYPIAVLKDTQNADLAQKFVELVTGAKGQQVLAAAGFAPAS